MNFFQLIHILIFLDALVVLASKNSGRVGIGQDNNEEHDSSVKGLQEGRTRRMIWLDKRRRLIFPPDTSLSVTPILAFPMFKESASWVSFENFQLEWTFFILFQGLGWTSDDNAWPLDLSFFFPNMTTEDGATDAPKKRGSSNFCQKFGNVRGTKRRGNCEEQIPVMAFPTKSPPGGERALLFPKLEKFLDTFGINGRACLQRAVCESHEIPLRNGFGLLGEFLTMLFSVSHSTYANSHLPGYLRAEHAGKFGDCSEFHQKCPHSIFTSKKY